MDVNHQEIARCLFRESNDALFLFDPRDHRVVDVNPAALRLTGFDKGEACRLRLQDLFASAEAGGLERLVAAYRRTGFCHSREGYALNRREGGPIPVNLSVSRIHTAPDPMGLVVARDISERIRGQEALRESEGRYRGLVEAAQVLIWAVSADGRIVSLNPALEAIVGGPAASWAGRPFADLVHPEDRAAAEEAIRKTLEGAAPPPYEVRLRGGTGDDRVVEILSAARVPDGDRVLVSGIGRDVTERRRAKDALRRAEAMRLAKESAEAADRAKSEFLGNISHEIRTPLTAILGFTDVLLEDERTRALAPELRDGLATIKQNGSHLLDLINDTLDLTKIEVGKLRIDRRPCAPARLLEEVAASMRPRAEAKGLSLIVTVDPTIPEVIRTDAVRFRQVLINLVSNAIKFTRSGAIRIEARCAPEADGDPGGPTLRFDVHDTGVGLSEAEMEHLFEPFYTSETRTTRESGAGLGLAISRRLAEMLGGRIIVASRPEQGSTFTLSLPLEGAGAAKPAEDPAPGPRPATNHEPTKATPPLGGRLLVAEDNESIRRFLALRLEHAGSEVVVAENGREAVHEALRAEAEGRPFDWILMDMQMPVLDGYEATRQLRDANYRRPIIALTAYAIAEHREECLRFGCDEHVSKPVDWARLMEVLEAHRGKLRPSPTAASPANLPS